MRVQTEELLEGCIVSVDVFSMTNRPIVQKKTIITHEIIQILKAFLIKEIEIEKIMVDGTPFIPKDYTYEEEETSKLALHRDADLEYLYLLAVQNYKKEFHNWQAGLPINISTIRNIMLPLIEKSETNPEDLFLLHHLSTNDEYLYQHPVAVGLLSAFIGRRLKLSRGDIVQLGLGGCLSDAGMAKINPSLLSKKTSLTLQDFEEIKRHPAYSYKMVQNIALLREQTKIGIFQHHERLDGSGYPFGENGNKISSFAKIIAVADTFHAMSSNRLYRNKQSPFKVLEIMRQDLFGQFDIASIQAIGTGFMNFTKGSNVKLSNGLTAEILLIEDKAPTRPFVKINQTGEILHLETNRQLYIEEVLK